MENTKKTYHIREEDHYAVHNMKPSWWMRWGIGFVAAIMVIIISLGSVVQYPDVVRCETRLNTTKPSITLPIAYETQVSKILIENTTNALKDEPIVILTNDANHQDIFSLENAIGNFKFQRDSILSFFEQYHQKDLKLGALVGARWIDFTNALFQFYKIEELNTYENQVSLLESELERQFQLQRKYSQLIEADKEEQLLLDKQISRDSILFVKGVISKAQYNNSKRSFFDNSKRLQQNSLNRGRMNLEITRIKNSITNNGNLEKEDLIAKYLGIKSTLFQLVSAIDIWKTKYTLTAPIAGQVNFLQNIVEGKYYSGNIVVITPKNSQFNAILNISFSGAGKVKEGQKVIIKLDDYPYREFGIVSGELSQLSLVAGEKYYQAKVSLQNEGVSSFKRKIVLKENMSGLGEIITEDRSLIGRVFEKFIYALRQREG